MSLVLAIEQPGPLSTLQDFGRYGYQRYGISASGAMDAVALEIANGLAGNPAGTAAIEMTMAGLTAVARGGACRVALAGADMGVAVNGRRMDGWRAYALEEGDRIEIGPARAGVYAYLAVAGGFAIAPTLGSLSTHTRSGIGGFEGRALRAGDRLALNGAPSAPVMGSPGPTGRRSAPRRSASCSGRRTMASRPRGWRPSSRAPIASPAARTAWGCSWRGR